MTPTPAAPPPTRPADASLPPTQRPLPPRRIAVWHVASLALLLTLSTTVPTGQASGQTGADGTTASAGGNAEGVDTALAYCSNLADAASDARFARKAARLRALEGEVEDRLKALEKKRAEYQEWLDKRQRFLAMAQQNVVSIYTAMRPDAASEQLAAMDDLTAAAIIARLSPRSASAVLNEMAIEKAARIATIMSGMARGSDERSEG
ncbi:MAG: hypothetical protein AcusKO_19340 [Acuticoccus sp.]